MLSSVGRVAVRHLASRPIAVSRQAIVTSPLVARDQSISRWVNSGLTRAFATRLVLQKKAAAAAGTTTTRKASKATKKPAAKKPAAKKPAATKKTAKAKAKAKKPAAKKPVKRVKKELSPEQVEKNERRALRAKALIAAEPKKGLAESTWTVYVTENAKKGDLTRESFGNHMTELAKSFKLLSSSEISRLQEKARQNKLENEAKNKAWIEQYTPDSIREANNARARLRSKYNLKAKPLKDERQPHRASNAFSYFTKARWASGDYGGHSSVVDVTKTIAAEWNALSEAEKEPYLELSKADSKRYEKEMSRLEKEYAKSA